MMISARRFGSVTRLALCAALLLTGATVAGAQGLPDIPEHRGERTLLPERLPLLPLPNIGILPNHEASLRIVEPRYRDLVADALAGDRIIGVVQLQPGFEADYEGRPPVFGIGGAAVIVNAEPQPNGGLEIVLRGLQRFRIVTEDKPSLSYRIAQVEPIREPPAAEIAAALRALRPELEDALAYSLGVDPKGLRLPPMSDFELVDSIVGNMDWQPVDRQLLMEKPDAVARARLLIEYLNEGRKN